MVASCSPNDVAPRGFVHCAWGVSTCKCGVSSAFAEIEELEDQRYLIERHGSVAVAMSQFSVRHRVTKAMQRSGTNAFSMVRDGLQGRIASVTWAVD